MKRFKIRFVRTDKIFEYETPLVSNEIEAIDCLWNQLSDFEYYSLIDIKLLKGEEKGKMAKKDYTRHAIWIIVGYLVLLSVYVLYFIN